MSISNLMRVSSISVGNAIKLYKNGKVVLHYSIVYIVDKVDICILGRTADIEIQFNMNDIVSVHKSRYKPDFYTIDVTKYRVNNRLPEYDPSLGQTKEK